MSEQAPPASLREAALARSAHPHTRTNSNRRHQPQLTPSLASRFDSAALAAGSLVSETQNPFKKIFPPTPSHICCSRARFQQHAEQNPPGQSDLPSTYRICRRSQCYVYDIYTLLMLHIRYTLRTRQLMLKSAHTGARAESCYAESEYARASAVSAEEGIQR